MRCLDFLCAFLDFFGCPHINCDTGRSPKTKETSEESSRRPLRHPAAGFVFLQQNSTARDMVLPAGGAADKENENGVSNGVLTKDAFFLITTVSYRSPRKKSITFEQGSVFMPIFPLFY